MQDLNELTSEVVENLYSHDPALQFHVLSDQKMNY